MNISIVFPTKNRPHDLFRAVLSVLNQTRLPCEIIIVDQSADIDSRELIDSLQLPQQGFKLKYIHDTRITGLVAAKNLGSKIATGEIICFLEDDIILEDEFLEKMMLGFNSKPDMIGCCGIVTNLPNSSLAREIVFNIFHRGIFQDPRVGVCGKSTVHDAELIPSDKLSGGISAWNREVFETVHFDLDNGFHMLEDIDFSTRVARHFGPHLYINPNARLEHNCSPINREVLGPRQRRKLIEYIVYYKKRQDWPAASTSLFLLLVGLFGDSVLQSFSARSIGPIQGYLEGLREGFSKKVVLS